MFDEMEAFTNLLSPGAASVVTAVIAASSVSINLYGGLLTERKRAEIAKQVERERQAAVQMKEMRSLVARYRGPLLEAAVDLESRLTAVATGRSGRRGGVGVVEEEVVYSLFTVAQFLGFVELVRREGPRERSFLQQGNPQGTDTLANLLEGFRFILAAHPSALQAWYDEGEGRDHPGARSRPGVPYREMAASLHAGAALAAGGSNNGSSGGAGRGAGEGGGNGYGAHGVGAGGIEYCAGEGAGYGANGNGRAANGTGPEQAAACSGVAVDSASSNGKGDVSWGYGTGDVESRVTGAPAAVGDPRGAEAGIRGGTNMNGTGSGAGSGLEDTDEDAADGASAAAYTNGSGSSGGSTNGNGNGAHEADGIQADSRGNGTANTSASAHTSISGGGNGGASNGASGGSAGSWPGGNMLHMSRGTQRAVGSCMIITPFGASRHYTLSYSEFYRRFYTDPSFGAWLQPIFDDLVHLTATPGGWPGSGPFPVNSWTRLLLLQQLLVDTLDLLDPFHVRTSLQHRWRLAPIPYAPLPSAESYKERLRVLESMVDAPVPSMNSGFLRVGWARSARDGHSNEYLGSNASIQDKLYYMPRRSSRDASGRDSARDGSDGGNAGAAATRAAYARGAAGMSYGSLDEADADVGLPYYVGGGRASGGGGPGGVAGPMGQPLSASGAFAARPPLVVSTVDPAGSAYGYTPGGYGGRAGYGDSGSGGGNGWGGAAGVGGEQRQGGGGGIPPPNSILMEAPKGRRGVGQGAASMGDGISGGGVS